MVSALTGGHTVGQTCPSCFMGVTYSRHPLYMIPLLAHHTRAEKFYIDFNGITGGLHWSVFLLVLVCALVLIALRYISNWINSIEQDIWPFITQMIPDWDAPPIKDEPGASRVCCKLGKNCSAVYEN
jgi:hypothetical protein